MPKRGRVRTFGKVVQGVVKRLQGQLFKSGISDIVHEDSEYMIRFVFPSGRYQVVCKETSCHFTFMIGIDSSPLLTSTVIPLKGDASEGNMMRARDAFMSYRDIQVGRDRAQNRSMMR